VGAAPAASFSRHLPRPAGAAEAASFPPHLPRPPWERRKPRASLHTCRATKSSRLKPLPQGHGARARGFRRSYSPRHEGAGHRAGR